MFDFMRRVGCALVLGLPAGVACAQVVGDPLRPPASVAVDGSTSAAPGLPNVSMIVIRGASAYALIDGAVRRPGERFGGYRVERIAPTQVTLVRDAAKTLAVPLLPSARAIQPLDHMP